VIQIVKLRMSVLETGFGKLQALFLFFFNNIKTNDWL